jgi:peptidoglycan/xylan/chitin deacetylase (PgdA/CDA1 family)
MGNPLRPGLLDYQAMSWADYGWRTGIWKILDFMKSVDLSGTFYASGMLTESAPDTIRAIADAGHELCGHAWSQDQLLPALSEGEERAEITRCMSALREVSGIAPSGWMSPRCTPSDKTARLLAGAGFEWIGDVFDDDMPYTIQTSEGTIAALPFGLEVNDLPLMIRYGRPARELVSTFEDISTAISRRAAAPRYVDVTIHAHVGGRPSGLLALERVVEYAQERGFWTATRHQVLVATTQMMPIRQGQLN